MMVEKVAVGIRGSALANEDGSTNALAMTMAIRAKRMTCFGMGWPLADKQALGDNTVSLYETMNPMTNQIGCAFEIVFFQTRLIP